jgi:hypothetical protein
MRSSRSVLEIGSRLDVRPQVLLVGGAKLGKEAQGPPFPPEERPGEGKTGRADVSELLIMPRHFKPGKAGRLPG